MKTKAYLIIILTAFLLSSCHEDLLVVQKSQITANSMWTSEGDATAAMYGMYNQFRSAFNTGYIYWGEYRNGMWGEGLASQSDRDNTYLNRLSSSHAYSNWQNIYTTINDCNLILKYTPEIEFSNEDNKDKVIANAYYVRAFCYYWIGRIWGDAPLLLNGFESDKQDDLYPTRTSADDIFAQVESDIAEALAQMPESVTDRNLGSRAAINLLKADYNLWMAKVRGGGATSLQNAKTALAEVTAKSTYSLLPNYASVFSNELNDEIIFAWSYVKDEYTGGYPADYLVPSQYTSAETIENPVKVGSHQQWCFYTSDYKTFLSSDSTDQRTIVSFETFFDAPKNQTFQWINKFAGTWESGTRIFDADVVVYRYADVVLFNAEIENALGNKDAAITELNKIAKRAYGVDNYYPTTLSATEVDTKIVDERLKEFAAEGKTWWDFVRFGVAFTRVPSLVGRESETNVLLWPVNAASINGNPNITQTEGYF
ncbi:RagB/SusD family nutrient uptake outer membrane protein [Maribellus sediminis]|uniref:RagB/SusD family nutrient uptake outer membrane protein n=1 Tax=Maribellus sediminis TaxID=2696285 RepID=UPI001431EFB8|nr:RagB/SusD family nutrient uptake outer membrane protein [Maribellus sediminis]